jgi:hypothetical protein
VSCKFQLGVKIYWICNLVVVVSDISAASQYLHTYATGSYHIIPRISRLGYEYQVVRFATTNTTLSFFIVLCITQLTCASSGQAMNLIDCAFYGNHKQVRAKLQAGDNVNAQRDDGITALFFASQEGHLKVVRALLQHNEVDVNLQKTNGATALYTASQNGHVDIVQALLQHGKVNVNLRFHTGSTALYVACQNGHVKVVRALLQHDKVDVNLQCTDGSTAFDVARTKKNHDIVRLLKEHVERKNPAGKENSPSSYYAKIQQDRRKLLHVMKTTYADPVELSLAYIERCIKKDHKLGSGAFGDVFLAEDSHLPKKFAVKMIRPTLCDQGTIENIRKSFRRELSVSSLSTDIFTPWE